MHDGDEIDVTEIRIPAVLIDGEMETVVRQDLQILLCKVDGNYHAISNLCPHANVQLSWGKLRGSVVTCPLHGARFDVTTGRCVSGPSKMDLARYAVQQEGGEVIIRTDRD